MMIIMVVKSILRHTGDLFYLIIMMTMMIIMIMMILMIIMVVKSLLPWSRSFVLTLASSSVCFSASERPTTTASTLLRLTVNVVRLAES